MSKESQSLEQRSILGSTTHQLHLKVIIYYTYVLPFSVFENHFQNKTLFPQGYAFLCPFFQNVAFLRCKIFCLFLMFLTWSNAQDVINFQMLHFCTKLVYKGPYGAGNFKMWAF